MWNYTNWEDSLFIKKNEIQCEKEKLVNQESLETQLMKNQSLWKLSQAY